MALIINSIIRGCAISPSLIIERVRDKGQRVRDKEFAKGV